MDERKGEVKTEAVPKPGDLRVWHIPQIPMKAFHVPVESVAEGVKLLDVLADYDLFQYENRIKPDYSNANGIERWDEDGEDGYDWFEVDLDDEPTPEDIKAVTARLRDISGRLARFEPVDQSELDAFDEDVRRVLGVPKEAR